MFMAYNLIMAKNIIPTDLPHFRMNMVFDRSQLYLGT